jgi:hypothetical protein
VFIDRRRDGVIYEPDQYVVTGLAKRPTLHAGGVGIGKDQLQKRHEHTDGNDGENDAQQGKKEIEHYFAPVSSEIPENPGILPHIQLLSAKRRKVTNFTSAFGRQRLKSTIIT